MTIEINGALVEIGDTDDDGNPAPFLVNLDGSPLPAGDDRREQLKDADIYLMGREKHGPDWHEGFYALTAYDEAHDTTWAVNVEMLRHAGFVRADSDLAAMAKTLERYRRALGWYAKGESDAGSLARLTLDARPVYPAEF